MCRTQHQTSSMGLYYVGYRLAERCWHVSAGKCAANSPAKGKFWRTGLPQITFQVSAQRKKSPICFNGGPERITEQFLIAVVNLDTDKPEVYVFTADDAKERLVQLSLISTIFNFQLMILRSLENGGINLSLSLE